MYNLLIPPRDVGQISVGDQAKSRYHKFHAEYAGQCWAELIGTIQLVNLELKIICDKPHFYRCGRLRTCAIDVGIGHFVEILN